MTAPGWYPDPEMTATQRYWDGASWTDHRAPATQAAIVNVRQGPGAGKIAGGILLALLAMFVGFVVVVLLIIGALADSAEARSGFKSCGLEKVQGEYARVGADDVGCRLAWKVARPYVKEGVAVDVRGFRCKPPHVVGAHTYKGRCSREGQRVRVVFDV